MNSIQNRRFTNSPKSRIHRMLGLYLHVPFCSAICNYCNFNRGLFDAPESALRRGADRGDPERRAEGPARQRMPVADGLQTAPCQPTPFSSAAARPSLLEPVEIQRIIEACATAFDVAADREVTLEANPETRHGRTARGVPRGRRQSSQLRRPVVSRRRAQAAVAPARRRAGAGGVRARRGGRGSTTSAWT